MVTTSTEQQGTVERWFGVKGYGFIVPDDGSPNVYVHATAIQGDGYKSLFPGQRVAFTAVSTGRHPHAITVRGVEQWVTTTQRDKNGGQA